MRDGWVETTFGDVFKIVAGKYVAKEEYVEGGEFWIYGSNSIMGKLDRFLVQQSHVIMAAIGAYAGAVRYSKEPSWINNNAMALVPSEKVMAKYLYLWLESMFDLKRVVVGTGQPYVQRPLLLKEIIELPPLLEQKRIVDLISSVDSYVEALQQQLESAKRSRNAVLHELLTAGGDDWVETTLGEISDVIDPHPSHRAPAVDDNGIPFIGIGDLRKTGDIDFAKARRVSRDILEEHKMRYNRSEFLIGLGRVASIGMVVRLPDEKTEYVVSPTLAVIKPKDVIGQFLFYLLEGPHSQEQFQRFKKGSTRESVGMQILRKIKVYVPPRSEQQRIVEIIKSIDDVLSTTARAFSESKIFRSSLLSELLSGEHEIPASYDKVIGAA